MKKEYHSYQSGRIRRRNTSEEHDTTSVIQNRNNHGSVFDYDSEYNRATGNKPNSVFDYDSEYDKAVKSKPDSVFDYDDTPKTQTVRNNAFDYDDEYNFPQTRRRNINAVEYEVPIKQKTQRNNVFDYDDVPVQRQADWQEEFFEPPAKQKKRRRRWPKVLLAVVLCVAVLGALGVNYFNDIFNTGILGTILPTSVPKEYNKNDVVHILVVGIDNEEGRDYGAGMGLTDMILYCRYDLKNNSLNMLQVPRDSFVGDEYDTNGTGKINALLISGDDENAPINNLAGPFQELFQLPVDHYVAMDMDALTAIVDALGGINVYVPQPMSYAGSSLDQGWQWMDGAAAEFFVRNRQGDGFERGDIDRLDNQRHFYSAVFRRLLDMTPTDIMNLLPVFESYCNTDIPLSDMMSLAVSALNLQPENVMFCKAPGATADLDGSGRSMYYIDLYGRGTQEDPGLANLLNQYFREAEHPVPAEELGLPQIQIPSNIALYPPNVQGMSEVQEPEGGADVNVEWQPG